MNADQRFPPRVARAFSPAFRTIRVRCLRFMSVFRPNPVRCLYVLGFVTAWLTAFGCSSPPPLAPPSVPNNDARGSSLSPPAYATRSPTSSPAYSSASPSSTGEVSVVCPYGHKTVRRAEVLYGLLFVNDELRRKIDASEVVEGGCAIFVGDSPAYLLVCKTCKARMDPVTEEWTRTSADLRSFELSLEDPILTFPIPTDPRPRSVEYEQHLLDGDPTWASAGYWTTEAKETIVPRLTDFAAKCGAELVYDEENSNPRWLRYELTIDGVPAELDVSWATPTDAHVSFEFPRRTFPEVRNPSAAVKDDE